MKIQDLKKDLEKGKSEWTGLCHDCGKEVTVKAELAEDRTITVAGGAVYRVKQQYDQVELFFKCDSCFAEDPILRKWKITEVYSRVVGYLRPTNQWNKGKREEFKMRKEFINPEEKGEKENDNKKRRRIDTRRDK